ncbi:hypothetical protein [Pelagibius sp. Alg239-R121]|uniref:VirB4 family type IV secretion/conjugal transfer ATPase n=1 Tax=Pelagibius sp. Alg239-R121 TaxID=2993448 RepID=UPI0024A73D41|nr:hypothetical protein [Pelagibius sp. Alg239-R121]
MPLPKAILANLTHGKLLANEVPQSIHVPITHFLDNGMFATKNLDVGIAFRIRGVAHETASVGEMDVSRDAMARIANSFEDGRTVLYAHTIRRKINAAEMMRPVPGEGFAARFDEHYRRQLAENDTYEIRHYLFVIRRKWTRKMGALAAAGRWLGTAFTSGEADLEGIRTQRQEDIDDLNSQAEHIAETLASLGAERLTGAPDDRREILQVMTMLINGVWAKAPAAEQALDRVVSFGARVTFRGETVVVNGPFPDDNRYGSVLAISDYCHETDTSMFDALASQRAEFIVTQVFMPMDRVEGGKAVSGGRARMRDAGDDAKSLMAELEVAKDEVASRRLSMGRHHFTIAVLTETEAELSRALARVKSAVEDSDLRLKREDMGLEAAWWAQVPGNIAYQVRSGSRIISHRNYADMAAFHTHPIGETRNLRWGIPITLFETPSLTPYSFSFHGPGTNAAGNTCIYGTTGSGKSTLAAGLICASRRLPQPPDIIYFDKDRVALAAIEALGGNYFRLTPGQSIGFNPFAFTRDARSAVWLAGFIERLIDCELSPEQERRIADAVQRTVAADEDLKNFEDFASLLRSVDDSGSKHRILDRLRAWHSGGEQSWLFGNREDSFPIDEPVIGLDMTDVLDNPKIRMPALDYLFYRIDRKLERGHPTIILLDEAWKLLDDERFQDRIKNWIKTIRSRNGVLVFMTQEPADAARSAIGETLVQSSETSIAFANPEADEKSYIEGLGFTSTELGLIRTFGKSSRQALIKNSRESLVVSTKLRGMDQFVKVLAGTAETVAEMDTLKQTYGDDWLSVFMGEKAARMAAE